MKFFFYIVDFYYLHLAVLILGPTNGSPPLASLCLQDNDKQAIRLTRTCSSDGHKAANRRKRRNFSDEQKKILESFYLSDQNPLFEDRLQLEKLTKLSEDRIHIWFQNRRAKGKLSFNKTGYRQHILGCLYSWL